MTGTILLVIAGLFSLLIVIGLFISSKYKFNKSIQINSDKKNISAVVILRNAGKELKPYDKQIGREKLPLQLDVSFSKKFKHLPITL